MLSDLITQIHVESHGIYGARRVHAELTLGRGVAVGHNQVELLMRRAGLVGVTGRRRWKRSVPDNIATDRVERQFNRDGPNQVWVTDITEHPTREGKVYCCVILDTYSRRVVGWSIDSSPTGALVTNAALGMAIDSRGQRTRPRVDPAGDEAPRCRARSSTATTVPSPGSTSRSNTLIVEVLMGRQPGWMVTQTGRPALRSPGRPPIRRELEQEFWRRIAAGMTSEGAGISVGVSGPVGSRWFRERGGMPSISLDAPSGRYLSFGEREEIALLKVQGHGVREIARRVARSPSTISRELRRNAATRSGKLKYRAGVAQWKAELAARRPKTAKLVANPQLHQYV